VTVEVLARSLYRRMAASMERTRRQRLLISVTNSICTPPTIYFLAPDYNVPSGGVRTLYRHVDILNSFGIRAFILHQSRNFRCTWFEHQTRVADLRSVKISPSDLLVVTELDTDLLGRLPAGTRHVILNQGIHLTWTRACENLPWHYGAHPDLAGVVTVSDHSAEMLRYAFDPPYLRRIHLAIDPRLFYPGQDVRARRIAYMPRRGGRDARPVLEMLRDRGILQNWELVPIDGLKPAEVGNILRTTSIFLSFADQEGFGLPAAEAMACANYVCGYHGFGGREFFRSEFSAPVSSGDILEFARTVEGIIARDRLNPAWCRERGNKAAAFIAMEYSPERERDDVIQTYTEFLQERPAKPSQERASMPRVVEG
jgi:hypothetical protein